MPLRPRRRRHTAASAGSFAWDPATGSVTVDEPLRALLWDLAITPANRRGLDRPPHAARLVPETTGPDAARAAQSAAPAVPRPRCPCTYAVRR
ncbi:hypothetical protein [Streptomyces sp. DHE17-7]|uniref:hypothetical protein n=1 Tax=Streptomyces sp. DHE17-7 TaxID=2759949 RepID=UPI0022EB29B5|nr:hypothetical protein [Streptomyces sp. DHE17-7]